MTSVIYNNFLLFLLSHFIFALRHFAWTLPRTTNGFNELLLSRSDVISLLTFPFGAEIDNCSNISHREVIESNMEGFQGKIAPRGKANKQFVRLFYRPYRCAVMPASFFYPYGLSSPLLPRESCVLVKPTPLCTNPNCTQLFKSVFAGQSWDFTSNPTYLYFNFCRSPNNEGMDSSADSSKSLSLFKNKPPNARHPSDSRKIHSYHHHHNIDDDDDTCDHRGPGKRHVTRSIRNHDQRRSFSKSSSRRNIERRPSVSVHHMERSVRVPDAQRGLNSSAIPPRAFHGPIAPCRKWRSGKAPSKPSIASLKSSETMSAASALQSPCDSSPGNPHKKFHSGEDTNSSSGESQGRAVGFRNAWSEARKRQISLVNQRSSKPRQIRYQGITASKETKVHTGRGVGEYEYHRQFYNETSRNSSIVTTEMQKGWSRTERSEKKHITGSDGKGGKEVAFKKWEGWRESEDDDEPDNDDKEKLETSDIKKMFCETANAARYDHPPLKAPAPFLNNEPNKIMNKRVDRSIGWSSTAWGHFADASREMGRSNSNHDNNEEGKPNRPWAVLPNAPEHDSFYDSPGGKTESEKEEEFGSLEKSKRGFDRPLFMLQIMKLQTWACQEFGLLRQQVEEIGLPRLMEQKKPDVNLMSHVVTRIDPYRRSLQERVKIITTGHPAVMRGESGR